MRPEHESVHEHAHERFQLALATPGHRYADRDVTVTRQPCQQGRNRRMQHCEFSGAVCRGQPTDSLPQIGVHGELH